ncbi:hypothetical protein MAR_020932 [Mya arenaria]|uniref:DAZ-associated protein 2 n=1 Tax=Mya arenaria TaxID=6604 RepID=A0ABY7E6F5_MYAAR|nr:protein lifeguard 1-like [Mya arenaria]WAR05563.1 hypothetical protein MAR_020932 [Mya arenaria]
MGTSSSSCKTSHKMSNKPYPTAQSGAYPSHPQAQGGYPQGQGMYPAGPYPQTQYPAGAYPYQQNPYGPPGYQEPPPPYSAHPQYPPPGSNYAPPQAPYYPQQQPQTVVAPGLFDAGARFDGIAQNRIPPPPPGVAPNQAQMAAMQGQTVVASQQRGNWLSGSGNDAGVSWGF